MTDLPDNAALAALEPEDLDGHSIDDLADYLDAGMLPADSSIDDSPACQNALAAIIRLRAASLGSLETAARSEAPADESWIGGILANISIEARSGRDVPLRSSSPTEHPVMTEGAIRSLVRRAGDSVPGIVVARCSIAGDITELFAPVRVSVEVAIVVGPSIPATAELVRTAVDDTLREQTDLVVEAVDVVVRDLLVGRDAEAADDAAAADARAAEDRAADDTTVATVMTDLTGTTDPTSTTDTDDSPGEARP